MWLLKMAWKNSWRNRNRTIITMAAIFFAVILSVITGSLQDGIFDNLVKNMVSYYSGYIQVHKTGYWDEQILDNSFASGKITEQAILRHENITGLTSRLESFALASSENLTKGCLVAGIDPDNENRITNLKDKVVAGTYLYENDKSVLLSKGLAGRLQLNTGDTVILIGQGYHGATAAGKYPVKGIVQFGSPDLNDRVLFMPLPAARELYGAEQMLTSYVISLRDPARLATTAERLQLAIGNELHVMTWEEMMPDVKQHITTDSNNMKIIQGILYLLICFGIFGTLLMMMVERKYEMGMLVAIGMRKIKLIGLLMAESVFTLLSGCALGILCSVPLVFHLNRHPLRIGGETAEIYKRFGFEPIFPTSTDAIHFVSQGLIVFCIGLLLSLYPLYKVVRLNAVTAMRK
ncbi:ABC transporter permease [Niastella caeni]|uniref:ABC transporter permease n=1 Tax=Niastella caeni TaxID=2569763 RepID=A0A4S8HVB9_9BACT|nr:FtsX-like permease family protein [Niastella caeni]THU39540.1 ABC transporter permease [Niastella caeni]